MRKIRIAAGLMIALAGCAEVPGLQPADPAIVAKINYVCAYSGAFKFADNLAASVIPVPGVALGVELVNAGVDNLCLHPERIAAGEATVVDLIARFKAAGRM